MHFFSKSNASFDKKKVFVIIAVIVIPSAIFLFYGQENVPSKSYGEQIINKCDTDMQCTVDAFVDVAKKEDKVTVLTTFTDVVSQYEKSIPYCHHQAHRLTKVLYKYTEDLPLALSYADQKCGAAVYHGLVEAFFEMQKHNDVNPEDIDITVICPTNPENSYALESWQCLHGVGHGLSKIYDHDVFPALKRCEEFEPGLEQVSCFKGTFMENIVQYTKTGGGTFSNDDIMFPCNTVDAKYAPPCYHYHTTYILGNKGGFLSQSLEECDKILPEEFVKYCYYGMGRQLYVSVFDDIERSVDLCEVGRAEYHSYCFTGLVMTLVNNKGIDQGFEYCKIIPEGNKESCYDGLGKWIVMLHPDLKSREQECSKAEKPYFDACVNASLEGISIL